MRLIYKMRLVRYFGFEGMENKTLFHISSLMAWFVFIEVLFVASFVAFTHWRGRGIRRRRTACNWIYFPEIMPSIAGFGGKEGALDLTQGIYIVSEFVMGLGFLRAARGGFEEASWLLVGINLAGIAIFTAGRQFDLSPLMSIGAFVWGASALLGGFYCFYFRGRARHIVN